MNLIERLGGYEKSKRELELKEEDSVFQCCNAITSDMIRNALLEHRRQHNIFEVGDKVVSKYENLNLFGDVVLEIEYFRKLSSVVWVRFTNENDYRVDALRHAIDLEIKAGRRL